MSFNTWLQQIGKSQKTAENYSRAISGVISQWANQAGLTKKNLSEVGSVTELQAIAEGLQNVQIYKERNEKGKGMYRCALNAFVAYRERETPELLEQDVEQILTDENLAPTEKSTYISARVGQGRYRKDLIGYWEGCAVTGYRDIRLLVASHIKPWRASDNTERLDTYNGLLLLPNLDKAFDLGFITFTEQGRVIVSSHLEQADKLGIDSGMRIMLKEPHQPYMAYHRERVFEQLG
jgi:hypothetical protein